MAKKSREHSLHYLNQEYSAMRWLAKQGLTPEEIREFRWGYVDETTKEITVPSKVLHWRYDRSSNQLYRQESERKIKISIKGSGHEWFFLESKTPSHFWVFTAYMPKGWRKEVAREALFPLEVVEKCCRDVQIEAKIPLQLFADYGNIEVSKLNIQKSKPVELVEEAEIVTEAKD